MPIEPSSEARKIAFDLVDREDIDVGHKTIGIDIDLPAIIQAVLEEIEDED